MSEPKAKATKVEEVVAGVYRWSVADDRIGGSESDAYAVVQDGRVALIDPLPIDEALLRRLGEVEAIVLTAGNHQRSAWRFRKAFGAPVYAPENAYRLEHEADHYYSGGDLLPCGLMAFHAPGPVESMFALWIDRPVATVFVSDLLVNDGSGRLSFIEAQYQDEPQRTRSSVSRIAKDIPAQVLCPAHGPPILKDVRQAIERAIAEDHEQLPEHPIL